MSQKTGICINIAVANQNLEQTECLQDSNYSDRLLCIKSSYLKYDTQKRPSTYFHAV